MAKGPAKSVAVYFDEFALSGYLNATDQTITPETPVTTCLSDAGPRRLVGNYDVGHSDQGLMDTTDDSYDEQLFTAMGEAGDHYLTKMWAGSAEGALAYDSIVKISGSPRSAAVGGAVVLNFDSAGAGGIVRGVALRSAVVTDAGNGTGQNTGATAALVEYAVIFRVLVFDGTNITLTVEQSTDDGDVDAYELITGLTSGELTDIGVVRASTVAATEAYKRAVVAGTFTSATILITAGAVMGTGQRAATESLKVLAAGDARGHRPSNRSLTLTRG